MALKRSQIRAIKAKQSGLKSFQIKDISENLAELDFDLKELREQLRNKKLSGDKATGELSSQVRLVGGARLSILSLVDTLPEKEHKKIIEDSIKIRKDFE